MLQSLCKEGNQSLHSPWPSKVSSSLVLAATYLNSFQSRAESRLTVQDGIDRSEIQQEPLIHRNSSLKKRHLPSSSAAASQPKPPHASQYCHASFTCQNRKASKGDVGVRAASSLLPSVHPHRASRDSWPHYQPLLLTGHRH